MPEDKPYSVLGVHGEDVTTVNTFTTENVMNEKGEVIGQQEVEQKRNVVRVRMFIGGKMIDEDFVLPRLITIEEQVEVAVTARMAEINSTGSTDPAKSQVIPAQTEQIIQDNPEVKS